MAEDEIPVLNYVRGIIGSPDGKLPLSAFRYLNPSQAEKEVKEHLDKLVDARFFETNDLEREEKRKYSMPKEAERFLSDKGVDFDEEVLEKEFQNLAGEDYDYNPPITS